ncbi:hypothetical protein H4Q26_011775 [Puccinia striiformis f. sp. tritici PST-130]|nr:hypothetical protein H4Q26_011775 [Puccinia striiformis f. sp. tritici PST-130]
MAESLAEQDISDPTVLKTYFLQAITNATENSNHSNPYYVAAHHIHSLMDLRAPLTAVSIVDEYFPHLIRNLVSACLSADLVAFFLAIFQVTGADSRFLILSIEWLPCFLAGWVFYGARVWCFRSGLRIRSPMVIHKPLPGVSIRGAQMFNFIMAHNNMVDAINVGSSIEANLKERAYHQIGELSSKWANDWIAWAVVLFVLTIPLVTLHLKTLKDTIRKIASECEIDLDQSALTIFEHQAAEDEPFLDQPVERFRQTTEIHRSFEKLPQRKEANKISLPSSCLIFQ